MSHQTNNQAAKFSNTELIPVDNNTINILKSFAHRENTIIREIESCFRYHVKVVWAICRYN